KKRFDELDNNSGAKKNDLLGGFSLPSKKARAKEKEKQELSSQIINLEKELRRKTSSGYYGSAPEIPYTIQAFVPKGNINRKILVIDFNKNIADQLEANVFIKESSNRIYRLINKDTLHFKKNEIVVRDSIAKYFRDYEKLSTEKIGRAHV